MPNFMELNRLPQRLRTSASLSCLGVFIRLYFEFFGTFRFFLTLSECNLSSSFLPDKDLVFGSVCYVITSSLFCAKIFQLLKSLSLYVVLHVSCILTFLEDQSSIRQSASYL